MLSVSAFQETDEDRGAQFKESRIKYRQSTEGKLKQKRETFNKPIK